MNKKTIKYHTLVDHYEKAVEQYGNTHRGADWRNRQEAETRYGVMMEIIKEDIVDTGLTISFLRDHLKKDEPASIRVCSLTSKPTRRKNKVVIDYLGFEVPNKFIVGYGIDYDEKYRNLPEIYYLEEKK